MATAFKRIILANNIYNYNKHRYNNITTTKEYWTRVIEDISLLL